MDKNVVFSHYKKVLDNLIAHSVFFKTYLQAPRYLDEEICGGGYGIPSNISLATGATRACIMDSDYDWVVKFDIDYDADGSACEREERTYRRAVKEGLEEYFTEVMYLGTYKKTFTFFPVYEVEDYVYMNDYTDFGAFERQFFQERHNLHNMKQITVMLNLYAYRRVDDKFGYCRNTATAAEIKKATSYHRSPLVEKNVEVGVIFLRYYGEEEFLRLSNFLIDNYINDLHGQNVGFVDGNFVILDFAGYHDENDDEDYYGEDEEEDNSRWTC